MNTCLKFPLIATGLFSFSIAVAQTTPLPNPAEGYYTGTLSNGHPIVAYILEDGLFWIVERDPDRPRDTDEGLMGIAAVQGSAVARNGTMTSNNVVALGTNPPAGYTLSASYTPKSSIKGTFIENETSAALTFTADYYYTYDVPFVSDIVANDYQGTMQLQSQLQPFSVSIQKDGTLTGSLAGTSQDGTDQPCLFSGATKQVSPSKNPYYVTITFRGGSCAFGTDTMIGVMNVADYDQSRNLVSIVFVGNNINRDEILQFAATPRTVGRTPHVDRINE